MPLLDSEGRLQGYRLFLLPSFFTSCASDKVWGSETTPATDHTPSTIVITINSNNRGSSSGSSSMRSVASMGMKRYCAAQVICAPTSGGGFSRTYTVEVCVTDLAGLQACDTKTVQVSLAVVAPALMPATGHCRGAWAVNGVCVGC